MALGLEQKKSRALSRPLGVFGLLVAHLHVAFHRDLPCEAKVVRHLPSAARAESVRPLGSGGSIAGPRGSRPRPSRRF